LGISIRQRKNPSKDESPQLKDESRDLLPSKDESRDLLPSKDESAQPRDENTKIQSTQTQANQPVNLSAEEAVEEVPQPCNMSVWVSCPGGHGLEIGCHYAFHPTKSNGIHAYTSAFRACNVCGMESLMAAGCQDCVFILCEACYANENKSRWLAASFLCPSNKSRPQVPLDVLGIMWHRRGQKVPPLVRDLMQSFEDMGADSMAEGGECAVAWWVGPDSGAQSSHTNAACYKEAASKACGAWRLELKVQRGLSFGCWKEGCLQCNVAPRLPDESIRRRDSQLCMIDQWLLRAAIQVVLRGLPPVLPSVIVNSQEK